MIEEWTFTQSGVTEVEDIVVLAPGDFYLEIKPKHSFADYTTKITVKMAPAHKEIKGVLFSSDSQGNCYYVTSTAIRPKSMYAHIKEYFEGD